jgi:hypothetical protein
MSNGGAIVSGVRSLDTTPRNGPRAAHVRRRQALFDSEDDDSPAPRRATSSARRGGGGGSGFAGAEPHKGSRLAAAHRVWEDEDTPRLAKPGRQPGAEYDRAPPLPTALGGAGRAPQDGARAAAARALASGGPRGGLRAPSPSTMVGRSPDPLATASSRRTDTFGSGSGGGGGGGGALLPPSHAGVSAIQFSRRSAEPPSARARAPGGRAGGSDSDSDLDDIAARHARDVLAAGASGSPDVAPPARRPGLRHTPMDRDANGAERCPPAPRRALLPHLILPQYT